MNFLVIFIIPWLSISLTERNNCSFPAGLNEFILNSGPKGLNYTEQLSQADKLVTVRIGHGFFAICINMGIDYYSLPPTITIHKTVMIQLIEPCEIT